MERIGAAVWATGRAGQEIVRAGLRRPWLELRAGIVHTAAKEGLDLGEACGLDVRVGAAVSMDVDAVLERPDIDVVFYAGLGTPTEVAEACLRANRAGKDAITIAGLVHPRTILGAAAAADLDVAARAAGKRILGTGLWDYLTITLPLASVSNVLSFDEIRLERIADTTLWGHGILRDEGIGGPADGAGAGFMMRNFLVEAMVLLAESCGLDIDEPVFESTPVLSEIRRERAGYLVEPGTICGYDRRLVAEVRGGGRLVSLWRGRFDLQPERDGMEGSAKVVVEGEPNFETIVRGDLFLDTYPPTGARAMAAVRPLMALAPGLHTIDQLAQRPVYR
jgi:4-hydroxy-tetrahydrodipicolinate reductase